MAPSYSALSQNPPISSAPQMDSSEAIDLVHLARQSLGDKELETELLRLFSHQTEQLLPQMAPEKTQTPARIADLAHMLKGSARAVGAIKIAQTAEDYENLAKQADAAPPARAQAYAALSQAVADARKTIADLLSE